MSFADVTKYNRVRSMKGLPVGAIIPWASDQGQIPTGWTVCNGTTISNTKYPILFRVIGNSYGGTAGSTFKLPPLTKGGASVMDAFKGHFNYLKTKGDAHKPYATSISDDPFWTIVGGGTNGDSGNNSQTFWISTLDLVGEEVSTTVNFQGIYDDMEVSDGSIFFSVNYNAVQLGVQHLPSHTHGDPSNFSTSYKITGGTVSHCSSGTGVSGWCRVTCDASVAYRVSRQPGMHSKICYANNQTDLQANFVYSSDPRTGWTSNGGGGVFYPTTQYAETIASLYRDGDGRCSGNMQCGDNVLFTSKSHEEIYAGAPHVHGPNNYTMEGKFQVISPGLRTDIALNTVRINNSPGVNFGTINVETATPSLEMSYIIRAF